MVGWVREEAECRTSAGVDKGGNDGRDTTRRDDGDGLYLGQWISNPKLHTIHNTC